MAKLKIWLDGSESLIVPSHGLSIDAQAEAVGTDRRGHALAVGINSSVVRCFIELTPAEVTRLVQEALTALAEGAVLWREEE